MTRRDLYRLALVHVLSLLLLTEEGERHERLTRAAEILSLRYLGRV